MNNLLRICAALAVVFFVGAAQAQTIPMVTGNNYYPYSDERLTGGGLATMIVTAVMEKMGATPQIDFMPWGDGYNSALAGQHVGTFPYIYTDERHQQFLYSDPIFAVRPHIFHSTYQSHALTTLDDMNGLTLCVPNGWAVDNYLSELVDNGSLTVVTGTNVVGCFQALREGTVNAVSMDRRLGTVAARLVDETTWFKAVRVSEESNSHYVIVSRVVPHGREWLDLFNAALRELQGDGTIAALTQQYYESYE